MKSYNAKTRSSRISSCLLTIAGALSIFLLGIVSCQKTASTQQAKITPLQTLVNTDTALRLFHRMLLQGNDAGLLADQAITWLLPTNAAFLAAGYTDAGIDTLKTTVADKLIRYHLITSRITLNSGGYSAFATSRGYSVYGMQDGTKIWFNGIPAEGDPVTVGNALVYRLNIVPLRAPADSLSYLLAGDSSLRFLAEVFRRLPAIDSLLSTGSYTLFAPVNSAFIAAGYDSVGAIDSADSVSLVQLVKNQAVSGIYFTNTLLGLSSLTNLEGGIVAVSAQGGINLQFKGNNNPVAADWLSGNQTVGNSLVVHRIDQVLSSSP